MEGEHVWLRIYRLLEQGVEPHPALVEKANQQRGPMGQSFIHWLSLEGTVELVERLAMMDIDLDARDDLGNTALMEAAVAGRWDVAKLLRDSGADPNLRNHDGESLADYLMLYGVELPDDW
jgi:ankyrin repeat protein